MERVYSKRLLVFLVLFFFNLNSYCQSLNPSIIIQTGSNACYGSPGNGYATVYVSGWGTSPYSYLWNNGKTDYYIDTLVVGSYSVTVTDFLGIDTTVFATVADNLPIQAYGDLIIPPLPGLNSGVIRFYDDQLGEHHWYPLPADIIISDYNNYGSNHDSVHVNSFGYPYWSNVNEDAYTIAVPSGYFSVYVHNSIGCINEGNEMTVFDYPIQMLNPILQSQPSCNGLNNGSLSINIQYPSGILLANISLSSNSWKYTVGSSLDVFSFLRFEI